MDECSYFNEFLYHVVPWIIGRCFIGYNWIINSATKYVRMKEESLTVKAAHILLNGYKLKLSGRGRIFVRSRKQNGNNSFSKSKTYSTLWVFFFVFIQT